MTQETCAHCGAPQPEATPFCTNCGSPHAAAGSSATPPAEQPNAVSRSGRIALVMGVVVLLLIGGGIAAAVVLGGDDDDETGVRDSGSRAQFCAIWRDFDEADTGGPASLEEMRDIADRMRAAGAPEGIPDDAQQGIDALLRAVADADSEAELNENVAGMSSEEQHNVEAAMAYAETTCADEEGEHTGTDDLGSSSDGTDDLGSSSDGTDDLGSSSDGGADGSSTSAVTEEQFCADMKRLDEFDSDDQFAEGKAHLDGVASRGAPEEMSDEAREGFELYTAWVQRATSPDDLDGIEEQMSPDEMRTMMAFMTYVQSTCLDSDESRPDSGSGGADTVEPPSTGVAPEAVQ